jgi:hypothetical protein
MHRATLWVRKNCAQIDRDAAIKALRRDVENVAARENGDAGVVDEAIEPTVDGVNPFNERIELVHCADILDNEIGVSDFFTQLRQRRALAQIVQHEREPFGG